MNPLDTGRAKLKARLLYRSDTMIFRYLGGKKTVPRYPIALVQTDGSFYPNTRVARVAAILTTKHDIVNRLSWVSAVDSTETEWASVYEGLRFAIEKDAKNICIENDNMGVVDTLLTPFGKEKSYVYRYKKLIHDATLEAEWVGIRWIPRRENKADKLFL